MHLYKIKRKGKEGKPAANQRLFNSKRKVRDLTVVADVAAEVTIERRVTIRKLAQAHCVLTKTIQATLHEHLTVLEVFKMGPYAFD